jgi:RNA polymerase sigma-70 factor (ECF subfamily)
VLQKRYGTPANERTGNFVGPLPVPSKELVSAEDRQLIAECLKGQTEAFGELVRRYQDRLYNAVFRMLGSTEDARDVVQEAFVNAYQALRGFKGDSQFFTWLYRIAMNQAISWKRKRRTIPIESRRDEQSQPLDQSSFSRPAEPLERAEEEAQLQKALNLLSTQHRAVLILKEIEGMRYEEIADTLRVPVGTIRSRLHRARLELREILERHEQSRK